MLVDPQRINETRWDRPSIFKLLNRSRRKTRAFQAESDYHSLDRAGGINACSIERSPGGGVAHNANRAFVYSGAESDFAQRNSKSVHGSYFYWVCCRGIRRVLGPINLPGGEGFGVHAEADYLCTASSTPGQTILGYYIDTGTTGFIAGEKFAAPVPIQNVGDFLSLDVIFGLDTPVTVT